MSQGYTSAQSTALPLSIANGGTGQSSSTGTGALILATAPTISQPNIVGVTTNSNATAGSLGEYVEVILSSGSAVSMTSGSTINVTSMSLTAGDWDVYGVFAGNSNGNVIGYWRAGSSTTSGAFTTDKVSQLSPVVASAAPVFAADYIIPVPENRVNVSTATTVYLVANSSSGGTTLVYGSLMARRIR